MAQDLPAKRSSNPPFFWLHIKKNGGGTIRRMLAPHYKFAERSRKPVNFIQSDPACHNDILNNFRIPLGEYQFKRAAFAKAYLYPDCWDQMTRFAFLRDPTERAVSMFFYLRAPRGPNGSFISYLEQCSETVPTTETALFDRFLQLVETAQHSQTIYEPVNLHFTTHTAAVFPDVTDEDGTLLLSHVFRLDRMDEALQTVFELAELPKPPASAIPNVNQRPSNLHYQPTAAQILKIQHLFKDDFELWESVSGTV